MADLCTIGPVSIAGAHLWDNNNFSVSSGSRKTTTSGATIFTKGQFEAEESFSVICSFDEALQLKGLLEIGEPVWINTSSDLTDNNYFQHKGWYILTNIDFEHLNPALMSCSIDCIQISTHESDYLTLDYTKGNFDGVPLNVSYAPVNTVYDLQDDGSTYDNWNTVKEYPSTATTSAASDGAEIDIAVASAVDGVPAVGWAQSLIKFYAPFTLETVLDFNSLPGAAAYPANMGIGLSPNVLRETYNSGLLRTEDPGLYVNWELTNSATNLWVATSKGNGKWVNEVPSYSIGTSYAELGIRMVIDENYNLKVYTDLDTTGTWTKIYEGVTNLMDQQNGMYIYLHVFNNDSTSFTGSYQYINVYNTEGTTIYPNIVHAPYNATLQTSATGTRAGEDGNISYYTNPSVPLRFQSAAADLYKGSVKLLSTNNAASASRQAFHTDVKLTPATTTLKNGFTKLTFDADEMILSGWDAAAWHEINRFDYGSSISIIKPLLITHDEVILQVNDTKVHMTRSPMISLYHPNTTLAYVVKDNFYYNGALDTSISASDAIAMTDLDDGYYSYTYADAPNDVYRLIFGKKDPTSIVSDSLPADDITGIGWNTDVMEAAAGINTASSLVQQWYKQTRTAISWKQIV